MGFELHEAVAAALGALPVARVTVSIPYRLPTITEDLTRDILARSIATSASPGVVAHR